MAASKKIPRVSLYSLNFYHLPTLKHLELLKYLAAVLQESMRLLPAFWGSPRICKTAIEWDKR